MKLSLMKTGIILIIVSLLIILNFPSLPSHSINSTDDETKNYNKEETQTRFTNHTILVEVASSQGCSGCNDFNIIIYNEYLLETYDFEFVEMIVYDNNWDILNNQSHNWSECFGISSYPTSIFDGGFEKQVGSNPDVLREKLETCQKRDVFDIESMINVTWVGQAKLNISIWIKNNENRTYNGSIRSHITEIESRYETNYGINYHNGFLAFAFDQNISILPNATYADNVIWDGRAYQDAHGDSFKDISIDNTKIFLGIFDEKGFCDETNVTIPFDISVMDASQSIFDRGFRLMSGWDGSQEFIPSYEILSSVDLYMSKFGAPTGDVTFQICEDSAGGIVVYEGVVSSGDVPSFPDYEWVTVDISDITVTPGNTYYIVLKNATGADTHNCIQWGWCDSYASGSGGPYSGGWFWFRKEGNPTWSPIRDWDYTFQTFGYE